MDVGLELGRSLRGAVVDDALDFSVGDVGPLCAFELGRTRRQVEHVALADQFVSPLGVENDARIECRGNLEGDPARDVRLDDAGHHIGPRRLGGDDQVNARSPRLLRDSGDAHFHIRRGRLHQVGKLVDQHDDVGETIGDPFLECLNVIQIVLWAEFARFQREGNRLDGFVVRRIFEFGCEFFDHRLGFVGTRAAVKAIEIAYALLGEDAVALLHFVDHPLEGGHGLFRIGDDGHDQVRQAVVHLHFHDLGVDHDETQFVGTELEEHRSDDRVDTNRLPRSRRTRHQAVWHRREIADDRLAVNILAQRQRDFLLGRAELGVVQ